MPHMGGRAQPTFAQLAASGDFETFANGFASVPDSTIQPGTAKHRPMGLAQAPDGALLVTDDAGGRIYRITYGSAPSKQ